MSVNGLHDFFAVLAIAALAGALVLVIAKVVSFAAPNAPTFTFLGLAHKVQLPLAALVAVVATGGSLYFSESGNLWAPCRFCWFQRIFMYSLAVVLVVAAVRRDRSIRWYAGALALIGMLISIWHMLLERGVVSESSECALTIPCATPYYISFGDHRDPTTLGPADWYGITLAVMAFAAVAFILAVLFLPEPLDDALDAVDSPDTSLDQLEDHDGQPAAG